MKEIPDDLCTDTPSWYGRFSLRITAIYPASSKAWESTELTAKPMTAAMAADFLGVLQEFFHPESHYTFGSDEKIYERI
ncbi:MAG: hypothetical protein R2860_15540 [Desulfobacterales bacterium]